MDIGFFAVFAIRWLCCLQPIQYITLFGTAVNLAHILNLICSLEQVSARIPAYQLA